MAKKAHHQVRDNLMNSKGKTVNERKMFFFIYNLSIEIAKWNWNSEKSFVRGEMQTFQGKFLIFMLHIWMWAYGIVFQASTIIAIEQCRHSLVHMYTEEEKS